jgi:hypothetical protein
MSSTFLLKYIFSAEIMRFQQTLRVVQVSFFDEDSRKQCCNNGIPFDETLDH